MNLLGVGKRVNWLVLSALTISILFSLVAVPHTARAEDFQRDPYAESLFLKVWDKADGPIAAGKVSRSWLWGPNAFMLTRENYDEAPTGERYIAYFDKARMELTRPATGQVTNGLLVVEMMLGKWQDGDNRYVPSPDGPAQINVIGDTGNWLTYAKFAPYASLNNDNRANDRTGQTVDQELTPTGIQGSDRAGQQPLAFYETTLGHNVPKVFWDYLNQSGIIFDTEAKKFTQGQPINWLSDAGFPITEAYWVKQKVGGVVKDVMVQAFQRRTLTYTPDNPPAYQVEMGNVGRHYTKWGYKQDFGNPETLPAPVESTPASGPAPTPAPPAQATSVTFVAVQGGRPGQSASVTVQTSPKAQCSITYYVPSGRVSTAQGLENKTAGSNGRVSWSWKIGTNTKPGTGSVEVTCNGVSASAPIQIG